MWGGDMKVPRGVMHLVHSGARGKERRRERARRGKTPQEGEGKREVEKGPLFVWEGECVCICGREDVCESG